MAGNPKGRVRHLIDVVTALLYSTHHARILDHGRTTRQTNIARRLGIGLILVVSVIGLATPAAIAHRTATHARTPTEKIVNGFRVFNDYFCASCHVMKAAGPASYRGYNVCNGDTACNVGVNFNKVHAPYQVAVAAVTDGLPAALPLYPTQMPSFRNVLTKTQIRDVAAFLSKYSGGYRTCTECQGVTPTGFPGG